MLFAGRQDTILPGTCFAKKGIQKEEKKEESPNNDG